MDLRFAINQISHNYVAIAGLGLHTYLFTLCSLDKLDVSYDSRCSLNYEFHKQEYSLSTDDKNRLRQGQANLLLLQIISGLEVALIQASKLASLIEKQLQSQKPLSGDEIDNHHQEYLKKTMEQLWKTLENSFLLKDLSEDNNFKRYFTEIRGHAEKLYKARNALMYRGGIIAKQDYPKDTESLKISYHKLTVSLLGALTGQSYNLQEIAAKKILVAEPCDVMFKPETITAKEFKIGDQINFEDQDLICIYSTFHDFTIFLQNRITAIITTLDFIQIIINSTKPNESIL